MGLKLEWHFLGGISKSDSCVSRVATEIWRFGDNSNAPLIFPISAVTHLFPISALTGAFPKYFREEIALHGTSSCDSELWLPRE